jgi:hypothetical protein
MLVVDGGDGVRVQFTPQPIVGALKALVRIVDLAG